MVMLVNSGVCHLHVRFQNPPNLKMVIFQCHLLIDYTLVNDHIAGWNIPIFN